MHTILHHNKCNGLLYPEIASGWQCCTQYEHGMDNKLFTCTVSDSFGFPQRFRQGIHSLFMYLFLTLRRNSYTFAAYHFSNKLTRVTVQEMPIQPF